MSTTEITFESIRLHMAEILEQQLGLPRDRILAGEAFVDLDPNFDSLSMVQVQLFMEEQYEAKFERTGSAHIENIETLPANVNELAEMVYPRLLALLAAKRNQASE